MAVASIGVCQCAHTTCNLLQGGAHMPWPYGPDPAAGNMHLDLELTCLLLTYPTPHGPIAHTVQCLPCPLLPQTTHKKNS